MGGKSEYDSLVSVDQHAVFQMPSYGAGEDYFLEITALANQVFHGIAMGDPNDVLFDDRTVVENLGDVVAGRSNDLHATLERLVIRPSPDEGRQE